jgi:glycosyltransferase involved in cell wall biosynthesis
MASADASSRSATTPRQDSSPGLSIVLCTWNNAARLRVTLAAIARCRVPDSLAWELVVVDNNCTDHTDEVVAGFAGSLPVRYLREPRQGLSRARNAGLEAASGRLILFTDDDVTPGPDWIAEYWRAFQARPSGFYFGGPLESEFEAGAPDEELLRLAPPSVRGLDWGPAERELPADERLVSANWACPRQALDAVGGFDTRFGLDPSSQRLLVGEESELMRRLQAAGWRPWYLPAAGLRHFVPARKTTLHHIVERREAARFCVAAFDARRAALGKRPLLTYSRAGLGIAMQWLRWSYARWRGRSASGEYVRLRRMIGRMEGIRQRRRAAAG